MLGRLIIAALVICSAAFVVWQRQKSETVTVSASVDAHKAEAAEARAAAAEKRAADAEAAAAEAAVKAEVLQEQLDDTRAKLDDAVDAQLSPHIAEARYLGIGRDVVGPVTSLADGRGDAHIALTLAGPPGKIRRVRAFTSDRDGRPMWSEAWDTQTGPHPLALLEGHKRLDLRRTGGLFTSGGVTHLDLGCSDTGWFTRGGTVTIELTRGDGHTMRATVPIDR